MSYGVDIFLPDGVSFGRSGFRDMDAVLGYVRGALKTGPVSRILIDGPSADAGEYVVGPDRKLHKARPV